MKAEHLIDNYIYSNRARKRTTKRTNEMVSLRNSIVPGKTWNGVSSIEQAIFEPQLKLLVK